MSRLLPGAGLPRAFSLESLAASTGREVALPVDSVHHLRVRRVREGARVGLTDGAGSVAEGVLVRVGRSDATVLVEAVAAVNRPPEVHLLAPVSDRDRMLWLAEKVAELAVTSWTSVVWHRSRSVSPRGEGAGFREKLRARMTGALLQSGGAWLPEIRDDLPLPAALESASGERVLLDPAGPRLVERIPAPPVTVALGPAGGWEREEHRAALAAGWQPASLGSTVLRFETAGVVAVGIIAGR